jgi:hypothetical protein
MNKDEEKCQVYVKLFKHKYPKGIWLKLDSEECLPLDFPCLRFILYTKKTTGLIKFLSRYYKAKRWKQLDQLLYEYLHEKYYYGHCSPDIKRVFGKFKRKLHIKRIMIIKKQKRIHREDALRIYLKRTGLGKVFADSIHRGRSWQI